MKKTETALVDRIYVLKKRNTPLSYMLTSKNTSRSPLYYFDGKTNRALRYAKNQKSPFEDEQDGSAILEPIVFVDGSLSVPKTNPVLQKFLEYHPGNGTIFEEVNKERDAQEELEKIAKEADALIAARELSIDMLEAVARTVIGAKIDKMSTDELKRDVLVYARKYPAKFLELLDDPMLTLQNMCAKLFDQDILRLKNKGRDIYFNLDANKTKLLTVPYGENPLFILASYLKSDDGIETMRLLESKLD